MASQWFCKSGDQEMGPLTFAELQSMIRSKALRENGLVRRSTIETWMPANTVIGLCRNDSKDAESSNPGEVLPPIPLQSQQPPPLRCSLPRANPRRQRIVLIAGLLILTVSVGTLMRSISIGHQRFPKPKTNGAWAAKGDFVPFSRPDRPASDTIPGLEHLSPRQVPGLEDVDWYSAPSFSTDLTTAVFSAYGPQHSKPSLFAARRDNPTAAFGVPKLISSCTSADIEGWPALSPDGLRLIFIRLESRPTYYYTSRNRRDAEFAQPAPWSPPGFDPALLRPDAVQFINDDELVWSAWTRENPRHVFGVCSHSARDTHSQSTSDRPLEFADQSPTYFISSDAQRAYMGWERGLFATARDVAHSHFGSPRLQVSAAIAGSISGHIWLTPAEDIVFYLSPGVGAPKGAPQKLWMLKF